MDETTDLMGSAGDGGNKVEFVGEFLISSGSCSSANDESESDLNIDSTTANSSEYDSPYTSPRALILASKSSEEELVVPQSMVRERHKWIERTLLKANDDMAAVTNSNSSTRGVVMKNRHSLPANTTSTASPGMDEDEDVLARVIMTTEARKLSREVAKAKVQADISAWGGDNDEQLAEAEESSAQTLYEKKAGGRDYAEVSDLRARAQLKLNSAMALLAGTSSRKTSARNSQRDSPVNSAGVNSTNDEGCKIQEDEVKCESPMQIEGAYIGDIKYDETSKDDEDDDVDEPLQQHQDMSVDEQLNRDLMAIESEAQGESEHQNEDHVEYIASSTEQHHGDDLSAVQIEGELAHRFESAADLSDIEKQTDQEDEMVKLEEEVRQSVQKRLEQDRMAAEAANRKEHRIDNESINGDTPQASFGCDIEVNNSSNSSGISASLLEKPSDTSDASLPSQVDEILYQGKVNHIHQEEGLRYDSTENEYEDIDIEHGLYSSASQSSEIDPSNDYMDMATSSNLHTPEPMLKMAVAQTSTMNAETRLDALDPLVTRQYVPNNARRLNDHSWREVEKTTEHDTETFTQWNGFNRERMLCMGKFQSIVSVCLLRFYFNFCVLNHY